MRKKRNYLILFIFLIYDIAHSADGLGRLFLTPDQRSQLETVRAQRDRRLPATADTEAAPVAATPRGPDVITYNGVVRRSDGTATVWINGKSVNERTRNSKVSVLAVRRDGVASVAIPQAGRTGSIKVGQSMDVNSGRIEESYARRATLSHPKEENAAPVEAISTTGSILPTRPSRKIYIKEADPTSTALPVEGQRR